MALMTPEQFEESLKDMKPRVFMNGKKIENILENRNTRTVVEANKASYSWALDPRYEDIMTCYSPLIKDVLFTAHQRRGQPLHPCERQH